MCGYYPCISIAIVAMDYITINIHIGGIKIHYSNNIISFPCYLVLPSNFNRWSLNATFLGILFLLFLL